MEASNMGKSEGSSGSAGSGRRSMSAIVVAGLAIAAGVVLTLVLREALKPGDANAAGANGSASGNVADQALNAADTYIKQGEAGKAEVILRKALETYPEDQRMYVLLAEVLIGQHRLQDAYDQLEKAIACPPPATHEASIEFTAGNVASMMGNAERATMHYAAAQSLDKTDARYPLYLAQTLIKQNKIDDAKTNLLIVLNLDPDNAIAWGTLAELEYRGGQFGLASQHVARARTLDPQSLVWRILEARIGVRQNKAEEALSLLTALSEAQQREPGVLDLMGQCYGLLRRPVEAAGLYSKHSLADPTNAPLALEAAVWLEKAGKIKGNDGAIAFAKRAMMLGDDHAKAIVERLEKLP
ncbi:MAG: tetratricopeptide repeat protein [Phycisphaerales bacterium]